MKYTDEQITKIVIGYNKGLKYADIGKACDIRADYIPFIMTWLAERGLIQFNAHIKEVSDRKQKILAMLKAGKSRQEVMDEMDLKPSTVFKYVNQLREEGSIKAVTKTNVARYGHPIVVPTTLKPGETIRCNASVSRSCVYGTRSKSNGLCRYSIITGKCRSLDSIDGTFKGCDYKACTCYSKISRTNPRITFSEQEVIQ